MTGASSGEIAPHVGSTAAALAAYEAGFFDTAFLVHDSNVACYWLFDSGQLLDEFNSCADYFALPAAPGMTNGHSRPCGRPGILLRFCRPDVREDGLAAALAEEIRESIIERLADALGIDRARALADYRDVNRGDRPACSGGSDDERGGDDLGGARES